MANKLYCYGIYLDSTKPLKNYLEPLKKYIIYLHYSESEK